jgi:small subunit ribosomal protein S6
MNNYEAMFIFKPDIDEEKLDKEINGKGEVKFSTLGKKTMAYEVKKFREGIYVNYLFTAEPLGIAKIKEALKHESDILRFMILIRGKK